MKYKCQQLFYGTGFILWEIFEKENYSFLQLKHQKLIFQVK